MEIEEYQTIPGEEDGYEGQENEGNIFFHTVTKKSFIKEVDHQVKGVVFDKNKGNIGKESEIKNGQVYDTRTLPDKLEDLFNNRHKGRNIEKLSFEMTQKEYIKRYKQLFSINTETGNIGVDLSPLIHCGLLDTNYTQKNDIVTVLNIYTAVWQYCYQIESFKDFKTIFKQLIQYYLEKDNTDNNTDNNTEDNTDNSTNNNTNQSNQSHNQIDMSADIETEMNEQEKNILNDRLTGLKLSGGITDEQFNDKFKAQNEEIGQGNTGDCYLVSALIALSRSTLYKGIIQSSCSIDNEGNYTFLIPLGEHGGVKVVVSSSDSKGLKGPEGLQMLEAAYAKYLHYKVGNIDKTKLSKPTRPGSYDIMNGGIGGYALRLLLGKENANRFMITNKGNYNAYHTSASTYLNNVDATQDMVTLGTPPGTDSDGFVLLDNNIVPVNKSNWSYIKGHASEGQNMQMFYFGHAYVFEGVDPNNSNNYLVENPRPKSKGMTKTISVPKKDITKIFPTISGIQIKKTAFDSQTSQTTAKNDNSTIANMGNDKYMIS